MEGNQAHPLVDPPLDPLDNLVSHLVMGPMSPPEEHIGRIENFGRETMVGFVEGRDTEGGFVAESAGRPVGQLLLTYEWSDWRNGVFWWIQSVYVERSLRSQGVFSSLFRHVLEQARSRPEVCGLRLYHDRGNERARRIYGHLGLHTANYDVMESVFRGPASHQEA